MISAWRLVKMKYANQAFTGEGASGNPSRWNEFGVPMVYTSQHLSLAALEVLVHLTKAPVFHFAAIKVEFDPGLVEVLPTNQLPPDWNNDPVHQATQEIGTRWFQEKRSLLLQVPSSVVPQESNFLLNMEHPKSKGLKIHAPVGFAFDQRLFDKK